MAKFEDQTAAEVAGMYRRRLFSLIILFAALASIPLGCIIPCGIGLAFKQNEIVYNIFMVSGLVIPLIAVATVMLMFLDRGRYTRAWNIAQFAERNNYAYVYHPKLEQYQFLESLQLFQTMDGSSADNLVYGKYKKIAFTFVDFSCYEGYGRYAKTYTQTILVLHDAADAVPIFVLYPRRWFDRLAGVFGDATIKLPKKTKFNDMFVLSGLREDDIVSRFLTGKMIDFCVEEPNLTIEVNSGDLILFRDSTMIAASEYEDFLRDAIKMAAYLRGEA